MLKPLEDGTASTSVAASDANRVEIVPTAHRTNAERRALVDNIITTVNESTATFDNVLDH